MRLYARSRRLVAAVVTMTVLAVGNGLGAPGFLFLLPAVALWHPWESFLLLWLGAIGAGLVGYLFARGVGRRIVERHLPQRLRSFDGYLGAHALRSVIMLRVMLYLATPAHWGLGLSSVSLRPLLLGSALCAAAPEGAMASDLFGIGAGGFVLLAQAEATATRRFDIPAQPLPEAPAGPAQGPLVGAAGDLQAGRIGPPGEGLVEHPSVAGARR